MKTGRVDKMLRGKKAVFRGKLFSVYQWEQKQFDGSYRTFEMAERLDSVQIIASVGKNVIMTREKQPGKRKSYLALPGGMVEKGEKPLDAARRELLEETGYNSDRWALLRVESPSTKIKWRIYWYIARNCERVSKPDLDSGERIYVMKLPLERFLANASKMGESQVAEFAEIRYNAGKRSAFSKKLFGSSKS